MARQAKPYRRSLPGGNVLLFSEVNEAWLNRIGSQYGEYNLAHGLRGLAYEAIMQNAKGETIWFAITKGGKLQPEAMFAYSNGPEHFAALAVLHGEANPAEVKQQVEAYIRKVMASYYPEN